MSDNSENCKGCLCYDNNRSLVCNRAAIEKGKVCPCSICLIKMMCENTCVDLEAFMGKR